MQEHLIPQDVGSYRFHLIGELDLKQFTEIMIGVVIAVVIYQFSWPGYIKFPLMLIAAGLGAVAAFVPIADRPLTHWVRVFLDKLFAPSKFYWKKTSTVPSYFEYQLPENYRAFLEQTTTFNPTPVKQRRALDYFGTLEKDPRSESDPLELFTPSKVNTVTEKATVHLQQAPTKTATTLPTGKPKKLVLKPNVTTDQAQRARQIIAPSQKTLEQFLNNSSIFAPADVTEEITGIAKKSKLSWPSTAPSQPVAPDRIQTAVPDQPAAATPADSPAPSSAAAPSLFAPGDFAPTDTIVLPGSATPASASKPSPQSLTASELPPLSTAKQFNLAGRVINQNNQPLDDIIISVKDTHDNPKAVIRTNPSGDFFLNQVLDPGNYVLSLQKNSRPLSDTLISIDEDGIAPLLLSIA